MKVKTSIRRWGNSAAVRLPSSMLQLAGLHVDSDVELEVMDGKLVLQAVKGYDFVLDDLLAQSPPARTRLSAEDRDWIDEPPIGEEFW